MDIRNRPDSKSQTDRWLTPPEIITELGTSMVTTTRATAPTGLLMTFTVHDEVDGETNAPEECAAEVRAILDHQSFPELKVPILWDVATGVNWKECA